MRFPSPGRSLFAVLTLLLAIRPSVTLASTFNVTTTADSGVGSLRQAITDANAAAGAEVLLLRTLEGSAYPPPACATATFTDVPCSSNFAPWIYELVARNVTAGGGGGNYCPTLTANRGQMATFVVKTFNLQ